MRFMLTSCTDFLYEEPFVSKLRQNGDAREAATLLDRCYRELSNLWHDPLL